MSSDKTIVLTESLIYIHNHFWNRVSYGTDLWYVTQELRLDNYKASYYEIPEDNL